MTFQNYFYTRDQSGDNLTSYEELLLLHYDDYLDRAFESEYKENDGKERNSDENFDGEYDKNEEEPGTFQMKS